LKKLFRIIVILLGLSITIFCVYIYKLRTLAVEGNRIFELRCTTVNPHLIGYKNSFLKSIDYLKNPQNYKKEDYLKFETGYLDGMKNYVIEEDKWLETQRKFDQSWEFQLFEPWYMKEGSILQMKMYESYRDDAVAKLDLLKITDFNDEKAVKEVMDKNTRVRNQLEDSKQQYFDFSDKAWKLSDWRKIFGRVPVPKGCTEENMKIPDTVGALELLNTPPPQPKAIPGLEDISS
jgi:hypothetical protein